MSYVFELLGVLGQNWPYALAAVAGAALLVADRRIGRGVFAALLIVAVIGGTILMAMNPLGSGAPDIYFQSLIVKSFALAGLVGYALACGLSWVVSQRRGNVA